MVPLRIGIDNAEITPPLSQFQSRGLSKEDLFGLVSDINARAEMKLDLPVLEKVFEKFWPDLDTSIRAAMSAIQTSGSLAARRSTEEMVEETLNTVRALAGNIEILKSGLVRSGSAAALAAAAVHKGFGAVPGRTPLSMTPEEARAVIAQLSQVNPTAIVDPNDLGI